MKKLTLLAILGISSLALSTTSFAQFDPSKLMQEIGKQMQNASEDMNKGGERQQPTQQKQAPSGSTDNSASSNVVAADVAQQQLTVANLASKGAKLLSKKEMDDLFSRGGEYSGTNSKTGDRLTFVLDPFQTYTLTIKTSKGEVKSGGRGTWAIDENGQLCLTVNSKSFCRFVHSQVGGHLLFTSLSVDPNAEALERTFIPASPAIAAANTSSAPPIPVTAQGGVASTGSPSATQEPIGNQQAQATTPPKASHAVGQHAPQADMASNAGARPTKSLGEKLFFLTLIGAVVSLVALLIAGMTNNVVVFYDWGDFMMTVFIFVAGLIGFLVTEAISDGPNDLTTSYIGWGITAVIMLGLSLRTIQLSVQHNRSLAIGIIVGLFKIFLALFSVIFVWGKLKSIFGNSRNALAQIFGVVVLGVFAWFLKTLVNGERVYQKKGWAIAE